MTIFARAYQLVGDFGECLIVLDKAQLSIDDRNERWWESEAWRLRGEISRLHSADNPGEAEECFQQALTISKNQGARSLELRAANSMANIWRDLGNSSEAVDLLAPIHGWFTEGFDTPDLIDAKALLDELQ